ncbi:hypothetical protein ACPA9J_06305 [Pseudomonas aeruginosa]
MIEPIREMLDAGFQSDHDDQDERWIKALREDVLTSRYRSAPPWSAASSSCATSCTCSRAT